MTLLVNLVAGAIAIWLAYTTLAEKGPTVTLSFKTAEGLEAGKTKVKYKDVEVGQVTDVRLADDLSHIVVTAEMVKGADVAQAEARLAGAVAERTAAQGAIETSKATYRNIVNQEPVSLSPPPVLQQIPNNDAEAQDLAEGINPNILAAEYNLAAAEEDVRVANSALLPSLDLEGALRYDDDPRDKVRLT